MTEDERNQRAVAAAKDMVATMKAEIAILKEQNELLREQNDIAAQMVQTLMEQKTILQDTLEQNKHIFVDRYEPMNTVLSA